MNNIIGESQPRRLNPRLPHYDYTQDGAYFVTIVTIVTRNRTLLFENESRRFLIEQHWLWLADQYDYVELDDFVVMPNHLHGIIVLNGRASGRSRTAPAGTKSLGRLVGAFKTVSTQAINRARGSQSVPVWQRNFHDHVLRTQDDIERVREYIRLNPSRWTEDPENPACAAQPDFTTQRPM